MYRMRILLADADRKFRLNLKEQLLQLGYLVVAEADDGRQALQTAFQVDPEVVIADSQLPTRNGLDIARVLDEYRVAPTVIVTMDASWETLQHAKKGGVYGYLIKSGINGLSLLPTIEIAHANFQQILQVRRQAERVNKSLNERKYVERAKGALMQRNHWSEEKSFSYLRKLSMDRCVSLSEIAKIILEELK